MTKENVFGLFVSLILTSLSFYLVLSETFAVQNTLYAIMGLALGQALFQLKYFLHLGSEGKPHWETICFALMFCIMIIIVLGSLWVMHDLNERMMGFMHD